MRKCALSNSLHLFTNHIIADNTLMTHVYYQNTESALEGLRENSKYFSSNSLCLDQNLNTEPYKETGMVLTRM